MFCIIEVRSLRDRTGKVDGRKDRGRSRGKVDGKRKREGEQRVI